MSAYDRNKEDMGNVIELEHVNLTVPDLDVATSFYVNGLGFTRDPYLELGPDLIWINVGRQQFHLPIGAPQVLRGGIHLVVPNLDDLCARLDAIRDRLSETALDFYAINETIVVAGPWGNRFICREAAPAEQMKLGIEAIEFAVKEGDAAGIGRFYDHVVGARTVVEDGTCVVRVGEGQSLRFREVGGPVEDYDGHHVAVYVANFSSPHGSLAEHGLVLEESGQHQYRFDWIVDPESGDRIFQLEHEVRALGHPLRARPLVNRNPNQMPLNYVPGADRLQPNGASINDYRAVQRLLGTVG